MFLMDHFLEEYYVQKGRDLIGSDPNNFSMVLQEKQRLRRALMPMKTFEENDPPRWNKEHLIAVMKMLIDGSGILKYDTACTKLGDAVVN